MRPRDFPERKNRRRKAALARTISRHPITAEGKRALDQELIALHDRIVPSAFAVVTRKFGGPGVVNRRMRQPKATA